MNRIDQKFQELRRRREPAFIPFITAGDPDFLRKL
ncbi:MAG TPA: tryptophan synthase subunit alpha, partial [Candidatus Hypogeohydataceae bacterium YC40]